MKLSNIFAALALAATAVAAKSAINAQVEDLPANVTVGQTVEIQYSLGERAVGLLSCAICYGSILIVLRTVGTTGRRDKRHPGQELCI